MPEQKTNRQVHEENLRYAARVVRNSLFIIVGLTAIKAFGGYITNIISLTGDAIGSFSDIIAASALFVGLKLSQKKANKRFTYGYHRIETFISLCISIVILYAGLRIGRESITRLFIEPLTAEHHIGILTSIVSIGASLFAFFYQRNIAQRINSNALKASAYDKRNDAYVSMGVLGSVIADKFAIPYVEGTIGILIASIILWTGFKYGKDALFYLLDYWNEPEITENIRKILQKSKIVTSVKNIRLRHAGTYIFGEAFLEINPFTDSKDLRDEIHRLDREVEKNVEHLGDLVLYIDPPKPTLVRVAISIRKESGLQSEIAENPSESFRFFFVEIRNGGIKKFFSTPELFTVDQSTAIAKFLKDHKTNILISSLMKPILYYNLRLKNIKVYPHFLDIKDVENTVKLLLIDI